MWIRTSSRGVSRLPLSARTWLTPFAVTDSAVARRARVASAVTVLPCSSSSAGIDVIPFDLPSNRT